MYNSTCTTLEEYLRAAWKADAAHDYEAAHRLEDVALHMFVREAADTDTHIDDVRRLAKYIVKELDRRDRGNRWCA